MRTLMATALAAILPLAGCFGGEASPAASPSPTQPLAADVGAIEGLVVDAEQRPVAEATVRAENTDLRVNRSATTGEDGRFLTGEYGSRPLTEKRVGSESAAVFSPNRRFPPGPVFRHSQNTAIELRLPYFP